MKQKQRSIYTRLTLFVALNLFVGFSSIAQSASDFWLAFEKCTQVSAFQSHYPNMSAPGSRMHRVMNHGITIPSTNGVTFNNSNSFELLDKSTILGQNQTHFFIIQDARFTPNSARFEITYYYNFDGSYNQFVAATVTVNKVNGAWVLGEIIIK